MRAFGHFAFPFASAIVLSGCDNRPAQWDAFIYDPNEEGLVSEYTIEGFKTFEHCQRAAQNELRRHGKGPSQDYECGYKCEYRPGMNISVCSETRK